MPLRSGEEMRILVDAHKRMLDELGVTRGAQSAGMICSE